MAEKVTWMVLKVDLQCPSCYKKIKKILCKFPQIRDQVYDGQKNLVKITVVCCSPEKIRDKLCCKGGKVIKSIDILEPPKPKDQPKPPAEKPKPPPAEKPTDKPKDTPAEKPADKPKDTPAEKPKPPPPVEKPADKPKDTPKPAADPPKKPDTAPATPKVPVPAKPCPVPVGFCCPQCYEGRGGGPCYYGYGSPVPPPPCYDNYYYGYGRGCYVRRCDDYFSEENSWGCRIM